MSEPRRMGSEVPEMKAKKGMNLLTNKEATLDAIAKIEGRGNPDHMKAWKRTYADEVEEVLETLDEIKDDEEQPENAIGIIPGNYNVHRYGVFADGTVKFSRFHEQANPEVLDRVKDAGFELY